MHCGAADLDGDCRVENANSGLERLEAEVLVGKDAVLAILDAERDADGGVCCAKDICDALAVNGGTLDLPFRGLSDLDFDCDRVLSCSLTVSPPSPKSAGK